MRYDQHLGALLLATLTTGCGAAAKLEPHKASASSAPVASSAGDATAGSDLSRFEVLAPGELARKIYDAFGPGMTMVPSGTKSVDYLQANASNFIGSISSDPNNQYASSFSIGYFMALAGLSQVVGENYAVAIYSNQAVHDCRTPEGADGLLKAAVPTMADAEATTIASALVAACQSDPASAASAVVQSYSTALKATF